MVHDYSVNGVKCGGLLAPKEVVIKNGISFKNGETKTAGFVLFVYLVICKKLGF